MARRNEPNETTFQSGVNVVDHLNMPGSQVGDAEAKAADPIQTDKTKHLWKIAENFGRQNGDGLQAASTTERFFEHVAESGNEVFHVFKASMRTVPSGGTISFDLLVNGGSVLSATIDFTSSDANGDVKVATINTTALSDEDIVEISSTTDGSISGGDQPLAWVEIRGVDRA